MQNINKYNRNQRATVCAQDNCVTVFGDTARIVNGIAVITVILMAVALITKVLQ